MDSELRDALQQSLAAPITGIAAVAGGSINRSVRVETTEGLYFIKYKSAPPFDFFEREVGGLKRIAETQTVKVPDVVGIGRTQSRVGFLILEWLEPSRKPGRDAETLGRQLAEMHKLSAKQYGLGTNNYIGSLPQTNGWSDAWADFYAERRLAPQIALAKQRRLLDGKRENRLEKLRASLRNFIDEGQIHPAPLHGDLWGGNWLACVDGPVLIDPAFYYGDREVDLAMTRLFGGFPKEFYKAYAETYPLAGGYEARIDLYQLYYLLVHLNLFGESYGRQIDAILKRYAG